MTSGCGLSRGDNDDDHVGGGHRWSSASLAETSSVETICDASGVHTLTPQTSESTSRRLGVTTPDRGCTATTSDRKDQLAPAIRDLKRGTLLLGAGVQPSDVIVLRSGLAECATRVHGRRVIVRVLSPGDCEGDVQVLLGTPMPHTVRAITEVQVEAWPAAVFRRIINPGSAPGQRRLRSLAQRLADTQDRLTQTLSGPVSARLAGTLLAQATGRGVELPQRTMAALIGAGRPSVNQILRAWHHAGVIRVEYGRVELLDVALLERLRDGKSAAEPM